ncbi:Stress response protein nst1 [Elasticomyces elasticus]|uniref:Stress response protein NST1 n=1 Tax=Elasticomyces elasticus TaxID=574655 RepID=A0AAN7VZV2_9PEZI|nr:Stress response protein nst1 [Elasticomyces elasticus]KAK5718654.1 Stress response protein nst1 [Elasticomyces elasticus]
MASNAAPPPGVNRKKQKRRAKEAAKLAAQGPAANGQMGYDDGEDDYEYSDAEADRYHNGPNGYDMPPPVTSSNKKKKSMLRPHGAYDHPSSMLPPLPNPPPPPPSSALRTMHRNVSNNHHHVSNENIWNTSTAQERQNIKDFWLSLSEDERKSLLKIEKEAVLRKMKQQQKHSCSCTVCGRKRTAIEEELEVLYEGYYEELEQYAHHDHPPLPSADGLMPDPLQHHRRPPHPLAAPPPQRQPQHQNQQHHHKTSALHEHLDEEEYSDDEEEEEEEYSDDEEEYSEDDAPISPPRGAGVPDFFNFGQNLTVKGILTPWLEKLQQGLKGKADNLLTVADDLLKNDGRKFIEMMEQLAERRMQRETEAEYASRNPSTGHSQGVNGGVNGNYPPDPNYNHEDPLAAGEEYDDEEASYDSQEEYDDDMDEESEMGGLTEEQRMQEGRRMFQIFAARMFEQRVLNAYREKVAAERQAKLLEELEDEGKTAKEREAKRQRDAQKKKEKKKQQAAAKAEEKAKKDAEKAAEEAQLREAEEKKMEEQRRRKEEQKRKKDEEKRKLDEERTKKEADRLRRLQEEQQRRDDAERKAREQKAAEKAKKDELRKRERDEREAREKEVRDRKVQEEREKKEREAEVKAERDAQEREKAAQKAAQPLQVQKPPPQIAKRPSQIGMVAVPGVFPKQTPSGVSSPHPAIATPAIPKSAAPAKARQPSAQGSHASSPKQAHPQPSSAPSKSSSPGNVPNQQQQQHGGQQPRTIMQKPSNQHMGGPQHPMPTASPLHQHQMQPPPGMQQHQPQHPGSFGGMTPVGFPGFQQGHQMMHGNMGHRGPMPMFQQQHHGPPMGVPNRGMQFSPNMNGMPPPPPPGMMPGRYPFDSNGQGPPNFMNQHPHNNHIGQPPMQPMPEITRQELPATHSRQPSINDKERFESAANQPIARPAPIQRPSSVKPQSRERQGSNTDLDDLSKHLGSSALLADDDEPLPIVGDSRRPSVMQGPGRNGPPGGLAPLGGGFGSQPVGGFGVPGSNWNTPSLPFGQGSGLGQQNWGGMPTPGLGGGGWSQNQSAFATNGAFGSMQPHHRPAGAGVSRPLTIRLAVCQACKQLTNAARGEGDGFHNVDILLRQIEGNRPMLDSPPTLREIEDICETEGDTQNGGGELHVRKEDGGAAINGFSVKWEADAGTPDQSRGPAGLGEIGSPMPSKTSPAFGAPGMGRAIGPPGGFQSLGAVGSLGF